MSEVVVAVHTAGVNPFDWKVRAGLVKDYIKYTLPMTPGVDFSGVSSLTARPPASGTGTSTRCG